MAMDLNGNMNIEAEEYYRYKKVVNFFDTTKGATTGKIGYDALLESSFAMFSSNYLYNYTADLFTAMDTDKDDSIDMDEFLTW